MNVIHAPDPFYFWDSPGPFLFLAGSIEMGTAEDWQSRLISVLSPCKGTVLNPRRPDWDSSWKQEINDPRFYQQVEWELAAQEEADLIACYFSPGTQSPITLLELGLFHPKMVVCCPPGFWRKGNVDIVCRHYGVPMVDSLEDLGERLQLWTQQYSPTR